MTKELTTKTESGLTVSDQLAEMEAMLGTIDPNDILVPKLLLQQGLSKLVSAEKAQAGDIADSVTGEVLGSAREKAQKPVKIVPLKFKKVWEHYEKGDDGKFKYKGVEDWSAANAQIPRFEEYENKDGKIAKSDAALYFYTLVLDGESERPLPYVVAFRRTNYKSGQKLINHFALCLEAFKKHKKVVMPFDTTFELSGEKRTNDEGTWWVWDIRGSSKTPAPVSQSAVSWLNRLASQKVRLDESDIEQVEKYMEDDVPQY